MKNKKLLILPAVAIAALGGISYLSQSTVFAATESNYPPLIQKIVEKFNLNKDEVNKLIEENKAEKEKQRQEIEAKREAAVQDKLNQAVKDGKITEAQKSSILSKLAELKNTRPSIQKEDLSKLSEAERKAKFDAMKADAEKRKTYFETWEKNLGVNLKDLLGEDMPFGGRGHMKFGRFGPEIHK